MASGQVAASPIGQSTYQVTVAASPKVQQMRKEQTAPASTSASTPQIAGYRATGSDGITASPKLRQQLDDRTQTVELAPVK
jgi:hypothetical protein